jgi:hypothetical protein
VRGKKEERDSLEIVEQTPSEVASDIDPQPNGSGHRGQVAGVVVDPTVSERQ